MASQIPQYTGSMPDRKNDSPENWAQNVYSFIVWIGNVFISAFNTAADEVEINRSTVASDKATVLSYKNETLQARDEAVGAVATLPEGIVNNGIESETDTYSSSKITNITATRYIDVTASRTAQYGDYLKVYATTAPIVITIPSPVTNFVVIVDARDITNTITVVSELGEPLRFNADKVDTSLVFDREIAIKFIADSAEWRIR